MLKPNSIIDLLSIFHVIHPQKQKRSVQPFCFWEEHSKGLSIQADVELGMINAISQCSRYCIYHVKFTSYSELIECSRPIRFFIVSLMYIYSCFEEDCLEKLTRQCRKLLWVMVVFTVAWVNLKIFQRGRRKQHQRVFVFSRSFLLNRLELKSNKEKLLLPIIPIGIVAYAFTLSWDNLWRNSCIWIRLS